MSRKATIVLAAMMALLSSVSGASEPKVELARNPFERPAIEVVATSAPARGGRRESGTPGLRAVLVAGSRSAVNFGGEIIEVGETAKGYQLVAVEEGRAVFINKGKRVVLSLYEQPRGDER